MSTTEYANLRTWDLPGTVYGVRATVTLPTSGHIGGSNKANGYFICYFSVNDQGGLGSNHYECGLSSAYAHANSDGKWHWMYTAPGKVSGGDEAGYIYSPGQSVPMELSINPSTKYMEFKVNGGIKKTFVGGTSNFTGITLAHLVFGTCDRNFVHGSPPVADDPIPSPLPAWDSWHGPLKISDFQYRNSAGSWVAVTSSNSTTPDKTQEILWPTYKGGGSIPQTNGKHYSLNLSTPSQVIATLPQ